MQPRHCKRRQDYLRCLYRFRCIWVSSPSPILVNNIYYYVSDEAWTRGYASSTYSLIVVYFLHNILARVAQVLLCSSLTTTQTCITQSATPLHAKAVDLLAAAEYPDPPNSSSRRKSAENNCSRRKSRRIYKTWSAAAKTSTNSFSWVCHLTKPRILS